MIRLSRLTDYAILLLSQMTGAENRVYAASELAETTGLTPATTAKILKQLAKKGIVTAQRGAAGGYRLVQNAQSISITSIIEALDGPIAITDCNTGGDDEGCCRIEDTCPMRANWNKVNRVIRAALQEVTLADMASGHMSLEPHKPTHTVNA